MTACLKSIKLLGIKKDKSDVEMEGANRLIMIKIEPEMSLQHAVIACVIYWNGDCTLPGASEKQVRGFVTESLKNEYSNNLNATPFKEEGLLVMGLYNE